MGLGAVYTQAGDPADVVKLIGVDEPRDPGPGHVLIRVTLFPIHWGDLQAIHHGSPTGQVRPGVEATGVVEKVGPGVHHVTPGARVSVFPQPGAWAERITADAQFVVPVPDSISDEVAAQMLVNPLTAPPTGSSAAPTVRPPIRSRTASTQSGPSVTTTGTSGKRSRRRCAVWTASRVPCGAVPARRVRCAGRRRRYRPAD